MSERRLVLTESQLHRYLVDAYARGADHQAIGAIGEGFERKITAGEDYARRFIAPRIEQRLIYLADHGTDPSTEGSDG